MRFFGAIPPPITVLVFCLAAALAQNKPEARAPVNAPDLPTFQSNVDLVLVPVVVRDSKGNPIGNLTKQNFQLFDKGKRQTIVSFSMVDRARSLPENKITPTTSSSDSEHAGMTAANTTPERHIIYLFDDLDTDFADLAAVREAATRHFERLLASADRTAVYTLSGKPTLEFTGDRDKLEETVNKLTVHFTFGHSGRLECPDVTYYMADLIRNGGSQEAHEAVVRRTLECNPGIIRPMAEAIALGSEERALVVGPRDTLVMLQALRHAIHRLAGTSGPRIIVLASPGFIVRRPGAQRAMADLLNEAAKANVTISAVEPRGVAVYESDASQHGVANKLWLRYRENSDLANDDMLAEMADATGGTFFRNNNNLAAGFEHAAVVPEFSYVLGFSPAKLKTDGSFHALKIYLPGQKGTTVEARHGYYALKPPTEEETAKAEIDDAVFSRDETVSIPVGLIARYSSSDDGDTKLRVMAQVAVQYLHFEKIEGRNCDSLTLVLAVFDQDGGYVTGLTKMVNLKLGDVALGHMAPEMNVPAALDVKPGTYRVRLVLREAQSQAVSTSDTLVTIP